jgi:hypothetical protein
MPNNFCLCDTCDEFIFVALDADQDCAGVPNLSQVCGLLIIPDTADLPTDWESKTAWEAVIDNDTEGAGKYLTGVGSIPEPEKNTITVAKGVEMTTIRDYTLTMEVYNLSNTQYTFLRSLQCNPLNYVFWPENVSGHIWGGSTGIAPRLTDVDFPLGAGEDELEKAVLTINWRSKCDPPRTYIDDVSENFNEIATTAGSIGTGATGEVLGTGATGEILGF